MNIDDKIEWVRLERVLNDYGEYLCKLLRKKMKKNKSNATFALSDSFTYTVGIVDRKNSTKYYVDIEMEDYWKYVNKGRPPGKRPPVEKIKEWIIVKRIKVPTPSVESLAYWVRGSIKKKKGYAPPVSALEKWIENKGLQGKLAKNYPAVESLAWAISTSIGKNGTKGTSFFDKAVEEANDKYDDKITEAISEDINEWLEKVINGTLEF